MCLCVCFDKTVRVLVASTLQMDHALTPRATSNGIACTQGIKSVRHAGRLHELSATAAADLSLTPAWFH